MDLFKKEWSFEWKDKQQMVVDILKGKLTSSPLIRFPKFSRPFEIHTNANGFVIKGVLMQKGHPIAFESKKFSGAQLKWPTHEKELFTLMNYLKTWQHYMGLQKKKVFMDNVCFRYFNMQPRAISKQLCWHDVLVFVDIKLIDKSNKKKSYFMHYVKRRNIKVKCLGEIFKPSKPCL